MVLIRFCKTTIAAQKLGFCKGTSSFVLKSFRVLYISHICQFLYTTALFMPLIVHQKSAQIRNKIANNGQISPKFGLDRGYLRKKSLFSSLPRARTPLSSG